MKKEEQIRMLLHPEKYTDKQLDQMLDEVNTPVPDANSEWMRYKKKRSGFPILKIAASIIGVLMLSGIAYATIAHFIEIGEHPVHLLHGRIGRMQFAVAPQKKAAHAF